MLFLVVVFDIFRRTCTSNYNLDFAYYLIAPSLARGAMLMQTGIKLDLLSDLDMLKMVEKMKRGGLCFVGSQRYAKSEQSTHA